MSRRGIALNLALVALAINLVLGYVFMTRVVGGRRAGAWTSDHAVLRLAAETALEEAFWSFEISANDPSSGFYAALRAPLSGRASNVLELPAPETVHAVDDLAIVGGSLGGRIELSVTAKLKDVQGVDGDPADRAAVLVLESAARLVAPGRPVVTESVHAEREVRVARVTLPPALASAAMTVARAGKAELPRLAGRAVQAGGTAALSLLSRMTHATGGFAVLPPKRAAAVRAALDALSPAQREVRAQVVLHARAELTPLLKRLERGLPLSGSIHCAFTDPVTLAIPRFRGRCLISFAGPLTVGEITVDDPGRDALALVTGTRLVVSGERVEAGLACTSPAAGSVLITRQSHIRGALAAPGFPHSAGIGWRELGNTVLEAGPRPPLSVAMFAPGPRALVHGADAGAAF